MIFMMPFIRHQCTEDQKNIQRQAFAGMLMEQTILSL